MMLSSFQPVAEIKIGKQSLRRAGQNIDVAEADVTGQICFALPLNLVKGRDLTLRVEG